MEARFRLFEVTGEMVHLGKAKRLLDLAVEHTEEENRETVFTNVALHRNIMAAWEEHQ